jgi:hypothetical protein
MNLDIFRNPDPSGKLYKESFLYKNFPEEYNFIVSYCDINKIVDISFKEKVYLVLNELKSIPACKNSNCNNRVKFKNSTIGYLKYCSKKCVSDDPNIKKIKEEKSISKWGTKSPAQSQEIKDKIIKTNQEKYGHNSPMNLKSIQDKSMQTLIKNWGVENPSNSSELLQKRIESFKSSSFKDTFKLTSLKRYGVEHPWRNKEIHSKTISHFYDDYVVRINSKINTNEFVFLGFEKSISTHLLFKCCKCDRNFKILTYQFYYRINSGLSICTNCFPISENSSISQIEVYNFIKENYAGEILVDDRSSIKPYEIDIFLPSLNIGFEFNGLWWHSSKYKNENYHLVKREVASSNNIKLLTIWEDDWTIKREICKSFILNKLNKSTKIPARKCEIIEIDYSSSKAFLNENHFQGDCKSSIRIGLFYQGILVSLMTFSKLRLPLGGRHREGVYELTRFCNKIFTTVVGGSSRLLSYFLKKYDPLSIETYSDNMISDGNMYDKLGFSYQHTSSPSYWYVIDQKRENRFNWRKSRLKKIGGDMDKTEQQIMEEWGFYRVYNAGNKKWILTK